jgi:hypothetical protein
LDRDVLVTENNETVRVATDKTGHELNGEKLENWACVRVLCRKCRRTSQYKIEYYVLYVGITQKIKTAFTSKYIAD